MTLTDLLRLYCLSTAVALHTLGKEPELVARIVATDEQARGLSPEQRMVSRALWRRLFDDLKEAVERYGLPYYPAP